MDAAIISRIAQETAIPEPQVSETVRLIEKGSTGPFIVHYRKEATGGLDDDKVGLIQERMDYYREALDRQAALLKSLSEQGKLTDEIRERIQHCITRVELDDLQHQFRSKKKTRLKEAIEKGLKPLAEYIHDQDPDAWSLEEHVQVFVDYCKGLSTPEEALRGCVDIIAEWIGENHVYRRTLREMLEQDGFVISNVVPAKVNQKTKYTMYYERRESVKTIPSHRVLAIRRGCKEGILISSIEGDHTKALEYLLSSAIKDRESVFAPILEAAIRESYSRILKPLVETEVRTQLKERADREAIRVFQENLSNLLLSPPAGPVVTLGVDWGKDETCSVAVVDANGAFLEGTKVRFTPSGKSRKDEKKKASPQAAAAPRGDAAVEQADVASMDADKAAPDTEPGDTPVSTGSDATAKPESAAEAPAAGVESAAIDAPGTPAETGKPADENQPVAGEEAREAAEETPAPAQPAESNGAAAEAAEPEAAEAGIAPEAVPATPVPPEAGEEESNPQAAQHPEPDTAADRLAESQPPGAEEAPAQPSAPETADVSVGEQSAQAPPDTAAAVLADTAPVAPLDTPASSQDPEAAPVASPEPGDSAPAQSPVNEFEAARQALKDLIVRHGAQAIAIGAGTRARELETQLRRIVTEENLGNIMIAAVNDAGIAIYSSSRVAREEFPDWTPSARCAVSLARRLQDPLSELVKIDPKLIGVGQYQHDVDQKELHRKLLRTVQSCVNKVGVKVNTAGESLLRYVSGLNEKTARRITGCRKSAGLLTSRETIPTATGMDPATYEQAAAFLRIPESGNILDRTAIHPESYPIVERMASSLGLGIDELVGNREKIKELRLEDYVTETAGIPTVKDIREELLKPGRDPRKTFKLPKFRSDVTDMSALQEGMDLEGVVTNVTNFGAFVDIGVQQDGLVHLSQMSNRFIRDPREAVKVGDIVQVKVISVEPETKRIGLSMKALLPAVPRKRRKQQRHVPGKARSGRKQSGPERGRDAGTSTDGTSKPAGRKAFSKEHSKPNSPDSRPPRPRRKENRRQERTDNPRPRKESPPEGPEPSLEEKIAILQSKFRRIH